jgi:acyl dehydratase
MALAPGTRAQARQCWPIRCGRRWRHGPLLRGAHQVRGLSTKADPSSTTALRLPKDSMDSSAVPLHQSTGPFVAYCDPDEIVAYALAINDPNPLYLEGLATPPTYAAVPALEPFIALTLPPEATEGSIGSVHGAHDLYVHKQIDPGGHLHTTAERCTVTTSRAGMNVTIKLISRDDAGDVTVEQYWSVLTRGPATGGDYGDELADHTFPEAVRANPAGAVSLPTTRDQTFRYAGASGERSPMHINDEAAKRRGFPRKLSHGLCTLGVVTRGLIDLLADGDPRRVYRIAVRFSAPSFPGEEIQVSAFDIGKTAAGYRSCAFEAYSGGATVLRHGRVEVRG